MNKFVPSSGTCTSLDREAEVLKHLFLAWPDVQLQVQNEDKCDYFRHRATGPKTAHYKRLTSLRISVDCQKIFQLDVYFSKAKQVDVLKYSILLREHVVSYS